MSQTDNMYALIIGVGDDLPYTVIDAQKIYDTLTDETLVGYPKENVILVTNEKADRDGILKGFDELREKTNEESSVLFYYSGHGGTYQITHEKEVEKEPSFFQRILGKKPEIKKVPAKTEHKFFLQPHGMTAENYAEKWVTAEELTEKVNAIKSNKLVFLLDCCHAEGMTQVGLDHMSEMAQQLNDEGGVWVLSSCQDDQKSWRLPNAENSLFTECLLEVMTGQHKRPFTDTHVTITDVVEHIFDEVPKRAREVLDESTKKPIEQKPFAKFQMSENVVLGNFPKNAEGHEATIARLEPDIKELGERSLLELLDAMEAVGRTDDAIAILEKHKKTKKDADLLNKLGDLYKVRYLAKDFEKDGQASLECHQNALKIATKDDDQKQIFLNAINLAFLHLMMDLSEKDMRGYAKLAFNTAESYFYEDNVDKLGTMAEANIYLNNLDLAKEYYLKVAKEAGIRKKMQIYNDAANAFKVLFNENPKDEFMVFLNENLLV
ncbi:MAG: caspase family protein [Croceitalea sp.]|nr:caspase family protein [Croceitalea sp.]